MAKKITSFVFVILSVFVLAALYLGDKVILSRSMGNYEPAACVSDVVCRVTVNGSSQDIKVIETGSGNILFLPTGTSSVVFLNVPDEELFISEDNTSILPVECQKNYEVTALEKLLNDFNASQGCDVLRIMSSENVMSTFIRSEDPQNIIDEEKRERHDASATIISESGDILFSGNLDYITPRGVTSFYASAKKSYEIRFGHKTELMDNIKEHEWLLIANFTDDTLIRNKLIYDFADRLTSVKAPNARYTDLYINGCYRGSYLLCEKVKSGTSLLDIADAGKTNDITGGYLLKFISAERVTDAPHIQTGLGYFAEIISPKNVTDSELLYINEFLNELEAAAVNPDGINLQTGKSVEDYLDIDSWIDKYLIENTFQNVDSSFDSCYFYKEPDANGGKLYAGPAWDYDLTATNLYSIWNTERVGSLYLCNEFLNINDIKEQIGDRFTNVFVPYIKYDLASDAHRLQVTYNNSFAMNNMLWGGFKDNSTDELIARTRTRLDVINEKVLDKSARHVVSFWDYEGHIFHTMVVEDGETIDELPKAASWWAFFNGWYDEKTGQRLREGTPVFEDKSYKPQWIITSLMIKNALAELGLDYTTVSDESIETLAKYYEEQMENIGAE